MTQYTSYYSPIVDRMDLVTCVYSIMYKRERTCKLELGKLGLDIVEQLPLHIHAQRYFLLSQKKILEQTHLLVLELKKGLIEFT